MWYQIKSFLRFYTKAVTRYNVQSPFLFDFVTHVLDTTKTYYPFDSIENERKRLLSSSRKINMNDFGAGSHIHKKKEKLVSEIASTSVSNSVKCRILFNVVNQYQSKSILELGTSLGISSAYMAVANRNARITTMEGDQSIATLAKEVHKILDLNNINVVEGPFQKTLFSTLEQVKTVDLAFLDGHHQKDATIQYYESILPYCHNDSIIIVDDIYWSAGMTEAWEMLISRPEVTLSIDLFDIGIIFLKKELSKQHVSYISYAYKPWKIGLFG